MEEIYKISLFKIYQNIKIKVSNNEVQIVIYIDSMSVTKSLMKSYDQENQIITIQELNHNQSNTNATVIWIPAHQGIEGNEKADAAVKEATSSNPLRRPNKPLQKSSKK